MDISLKIMDQINIHNILKASVNQQEKNDKLANRKKECAKVIKKKLIEGHILMANKDM